MEVSITPLIVIALYLGLLLLWLAAVLTAVTGWDYFTKARPYLEEREA